MGSVRDIDKGYKALLRKVAGARDCKVKVGILEGEAEKPHGRATNYDVAVWMELGFTHVKAGPIPPRSFIGAYVDEEQDNIFSWQRRVLTAVLKGQYNLDDGLDRFGQLVVSGMKLRIEAGKVHPALRPATIDRKGSDIPLLEMGQMKNAITFRVLGKEIPS